MLMDVDRNGENGDEDEHRYATITTTITDAASGSSNNNNGGGGGESLLPVPVLNAPGTAALMSEEDEVLKLWSVVVGLSSWCTRSFSFCGSRIEFAVRAHTKPSTGCRDVGAECAQVAHAGRRRARAAGCSGLPFGWLPLIAHTVVAQPGQVSLPETAAPFGDPLAELHQRLAQVRCLVVCGEHHRRLTLAAAPARVDADTQARRVPAGACAAVRRPL